MGNKASHSTSVSQLTLDALLLRPSALRLSMFSLHATAHHGVPSNTRALAFCGLQGILAVGTASGTVKLYGANGLEVLLVGPTSHLAVGVTHLKFTARQRLVAVYTDNSIRVFDLVSGAALCCVSNNWTTSVITSVETISYNNFPFFFVATDDGNVHVVHEETGRRSIYVIQPQDLTTCNAEGITAMSSHPKDSNLLLIAYNTCPDVLLWDFAKRKVVREFSLSEKVHKLASPPTSNVFVAGYKHGGFAVFRVDNSHGLYRHAAGTVPSKQVTPVKQIKWVCASPTSKHVALPGAIVFSGGHPDPTESKLLTVVYPPIDGRSTNDTLKDLYKAEKLTWCITTIESANHAEIADFVAIQDQVDSCTKMAPLSLIILSGNPLDGCLPTVSVQGLPCFVKVCADDREEWEWRMDRLPDPAIIPPLLQLSPLTTFALVNISHSDSTLQDDLLSTWNQTKYNPMFRLMESGDFEWPINGGSVVEPMLKGFLTTSGVLNSGADIATNGMMLLTGHETGYVLFWEAQTAGDRVSKGALRLIHMVDLSVQMSPAPVNLEITCLAFCADSRTLVVGFASGEIVVLEFDQLKRNTSVTDGVHEDKDSKVKDGAIDRERYLDPDKPGSCVEGEDQNEAVGFRILFSMHVHTEPISKLVVSSSYGYVGVADAAGIVSLVETKTQAFQLLFRDIAPNCDDSKSVDSLLMSELVQTTKIPGSNFSSLSSLPVDNEHGGKVSPGKRGISSGDAKFHNMLQYREVIPVLFVGRGSGKMEMYHVHSATKMGVMLLNPEKSSSLSSIFMVDSDGKRIGIPGHKWVKHDKKLSVAGSILDPAKSANSIGMVKPDLAEDTQEGDVANTIEDQSCNRQAVMPNAKLELTQELVMAAKNERSKAAATGVIPAFISSKPTWKQSSRIEVTAPAGSLGLHLFMEVEQHAVVKGFADDSSTALLLASKGIHIGYTLTAINGVDVIPLDRDLVCRVLEKLREREKVLVFAIGFKGPEISVNDDIGTSNGPLVDSRNVAEDERPRFLVCTCGRAIHVVRATVPRAAEMAMGPKEISAVPLASVELQGTVLVTSVVRVPVGEGVENCLAVVDQNKHVYVLSLLSLKPIWEADWDNFGLGLSYSSLGDGILLDISYGGELVVANAFGEIERFSLFAEATAMESAMLECMSITTRVYLPERATIFDQAASPLATTSSGKKQSVAADAGKMLKKMVLSVTQEVTDLNKVFHFSTYEEERKRLMGYRSSPAKDARSAATQTETGLSATKDSLMQAQQRLAERGEKLNDLGLKTEQMKKTSEDFYHTMKAFNKKNRNKKWYEF
ncbi:unnamed protein product [Peronospora destructor]|uniref:V-SNARE coiled-coil homology domain-containing protein n=1 Tax=Peronospora destructor TaxID=86335 RepID=A0AAV0T583_9STRA|nr:unnamed protein product [Peronospora destructor]